MSIYDLQGMESTAPQTGNSGGSSGSGHSCPSDLSVTLCDGTSDLSVLLCH
jgi:hypothetical protein